MFFDPVNFNGEVFDTAVKTTPNLNRNALLKSGAIVPAQQYAAQLKDQQGGHYATTIIKARIGGTPVNYDGGTDIGSTSRGNYTMGRIVVGRANGWTEKDFVSDISGNDYGAAVTEVAEYWDDIDQATLLSILKGVYNMTGAKNLEFVNGHTYNISNAVAPKFSETTLNTGIQKALGDNKGKFALAIMHSQISTNLENLNLLSYMKYTDAQGIERDLTLATLNGRMVLIDDNMPADEGYFDATSDTVGALQIVASGATTGQINLSAVTPYFGDKTLAADMYVVKDIRYTTYVLGNGAIEYTDCGAKVPAEMFRDPAKNGGETTLYSRQRKVFAPYGISFITNSIISPTNAQLENGANWSLASNNAETKSYYPHKAIPIARIQTRG